MYLFFILARKFLWVNVIDFSFLRTFVCVWISFWGEGSWNRTGPVSVTELIFYVHVHSTFQEFIFWQNLDRFFYENQRIHPHPWDRIFPTYAYWQLIHVNSVYWNCDLTTKRQYKQSSMSTQNRWQHEIGGHFSNNNISMRFEFNRCALWSEVSQLYRHIITNNFNETKNELNLFTCLKCMGNFCHVTLFRTHSSISVFIFPLIDFCIVSNKFTIWCVLHNISNVLFWL